MKPQNACVKSLIFTTTITERNKTLKQTERKGKEIQEKELAIEMNVKNIYNWVNTQITQYLHRVWQNKSSLGFYRDSNRISQHPLMIYYRLIGNKTSHRNNNNNKLFHYLTRHSTNQNLSNNIENYREKNNLKKCRPF